MQLKTILISGVVLATAATVGVPAQDEGRRGEFGFGAGAALADASLTGGSGEIDLTVALRGGYRFGRAWNWFIDYSYAEFDSDSILRKIDTHQLHTGVELLFNPEVRWTLFSQFGVGYMTAGDDLDVVDLGRPLLSVGFGVQRRSRGANFYWLIRGSWTVTNDDLAREAVYGAETLLGLTWSFGRGKRDSDGDGVYDKSDECPGTPGGARVDAVGCPIDSDGDGVYDGLDRCPDTPAGWPVNPSGCPIDSDADGVPDGGDRCPDTPAGAVVDDDGCPLDGDGDGVYDGIDRCIDTPRGAVVDAEGCPLDGDRDGVFDGLDQCPDTAPGLEVDDRGCALPAPLFEAAAVVVLHGVNFHTDSAVLTLEAQDRLDEVAASLLRNPEVRIEIAGHTDSVGDAGYNQRLSELRARAVKDYLARAGVDPLQMVVRGYGETQPLASNDTADGRTLNRRVELRKLE